jgi:DNA-binding LytR/AlgR family response regulator
MKLYRIAICEDETVFRKTQESICREVCEKLKIEYNVSVFKDGKDFWHTFTSGARYDLLLLDIVMDETNGVELARKIRGCDGDAAIIFITSNPEFALQGYDVNALHYLLKPLDASKLERLIALDYRHRFQNHYLVFKFGAQTHSVPVKDIICIKTVDRRAAITLPDKIIEYP